VRVRARARLGIRELVRQVRAGNGELVPRGGGALRALKRAALVEKTLARGGGGAVTPVCESAERLIVEIDAAATVAAATVSLLVETIVRARAAVVPGGVVERERAGRRRQRQIGARLQNRGGFHARPRLRRARRRVARRGAGALQQRRLEPRRHGVGVQTHERVQEGSAAPLREPRHAVPRLRAVAAAEATRQHVKIRHHASHVRLGHLAVRGNRARVQTTVRRASKGTPRGRGAIRRISGHGLVFDVSEREPAVVPGDGAEEVVPRRRRALRRRAQSFPDVARAGVARGGERRQHLQRRGERLHAVLPLADGVQEHAQRRLVRTRLGRVAPIRTFGEVFRDVAPRRLRALAVRLRERSAQRDERRFAHRILILAHRAQTLTLGKVHVVIIVSDGSVVTVRGDAVRVERVILRAVRAVREIVGARGVALLARDLLRRHRRRHRGERVAQVGVVQSRAHRGTQNFQTEIQVRSPGKLVFVAKGARRQHAPQRHERAFVRRGDDFLLGRLRVSLPTRRSWTFPTFPKKWRTTRRVRG
jgi:hypothetical protein